MKNLKKIVRKGSLIELISLSLRIFWPLSRLEKKEWSSNKRAINTYKYLEKHYSHLINSRTQSSEVSHDKEGKIWICWLQGEEKAPDIVKMCISSIRHFNPEYEIIILNENNITNYVSFPDYILDKWKSGVISNAHFSDILRTEILIDHGGTWIDATVFCTGKIDTEILNANLFAYRVHYNEKNNPPIVASSWFLSASKNNDLLIATRDMLYLYWQEHNILMNYYLFHIFFTIATRKYFEQWNLVPKISNANSHFLQFELNEPFDGHTYEQIKKISKIHKLTYKGLDNTNSNVFHKVLLNERI